MSLTDQILLIIFKNLYTINALNLIGINERLNNILYDREMINHLKLFRQSTNDLIYPLDDKLIHQLCVEILPKIHHEIKWFNLVVSSIWLVIAPPFPPFYKISPPSPLFSIDFLLFCSFRCKY